MVIEIMSHRSCEVLVNFMYEEMNRFIGRPDQERILMPSSARQSGGKALGSAIHARATDSCTIYISGYCGKPQARTMSVRSKCGTRGSRRLLSFLCDEQPPWLEKDEGGNVEGR